MTPLPIGSPSRHRLPHQADGWENFKVFFVLRVTAIILDPPPANNYVFCTRFAAYAEPRILLDSRSCVFLNPIYYITNFSRLSTVRHAFYGIQFDFLEKICYFLVKIASVTPETPRTRFLSTHKHPLSRHVTLLQNDPIASKN